LFDTATFVLRLLIGQETPRDELFARRQMGERA